MSQQRIPAGLVWLLLTLCGAAALLLAIWYGLQSSWLFMLLALISITLLGIRDIMSHSDGRRQRCEQLCQRAEELGFTFRETAEFNPLGWDASFELTREAFQWRTVEEELSLLSRYVRLAAPKSRHLLLKSEKAVEIALFDYEFSQNDAIYCQATAALAASELPQAYCAWHPANTWHKLADGWRNTSAIHASHRLVTEASIAESEAAAVADCLDADATLEVGQGYLLLYRKDCRPLQPAELEIRLAELMRVYELVRRICVTTTDVASSPAREAAQQAH